MATKGWHSMSVFSDYWGDDRIEREFEESGLKCCTRTNDMGHRCGYVAVSEGHPLYGMGYDKLYDEHPEIEVDGGVTFASGADGTWMFGWDAAHAWHERDWSIASEGLRKSRDKYPELYADFGWPGGSYMVDADRAERETRDLARQIAEIGRGE